MRLTQRSAFGFIFGGGFAIAGGLAGAACSGGDFHGCAAARTCSPSSAGASGASTVGHAGESAGGKAGQGGASGLGSSAIAGNSAKPGAGGQGDGGSPDDAGAGNAHESSGAGGRRTDSPATGGTGGNETTRPSGAGGSDDGSAAQAGMAGDASDVPHDTKAPTIVKVSPPYGATGVTSDTEIVVDFDEPMDNAKTEAAYQSVDLPSPDAVNLFWRNDSKELVIQPKKVLTYAAGGPTSDPKHYDFTIAGTATDTAGNSLGQDQHYGFTTLRQVSEVLLVPQDGGRLVSQPVKGDVKRFKRCPGFDSLLQAGDDNDDGAYFSLVTFDLSQLQPGIVEWRQADFRVQVDPASALNPFRLGDLNLDALVVDPDRVVWESPITASLGPLSTYLSNQVPSMDVLDNIRRDYAARATQSNRSQYLIRFAEPTDSDEHQAYLQIPCDSVRIYLEYLAP